MSTDRESNAREIAAFNPRDVAGYEAYVERTDRLGRALFDSFSDDDPSFERFDSETQTLLRGSAADLVERYVQTPVLQAELVNDGLIGTYLGPRDAGTGYVLAHHLAGRLLGTQGAWAYVRGGMGSVSQALASAARSYGAEVFADATIERIAIDDGRACGVEVGGKLVRARAVASNAHPRTTFFELLDGSLFDAAFAAKVEEWKSVGPSLKLNLALGELPNFTCRPGTDPQAHHFATIHVAPSIAYLAKGLFRRAPRRRKRGAADRVFPSDADRFVARAARQAHPLDLRAVLSVRSRRRLAGRQARGRRREDRRDPGALRAEPARRNRMAPGARSAGFGVALWFSWRTYFPRRAAAGSDLPRSVRDAYTRAQPVSVRIGRAPRRVRQRLSRQTRGGCDLTRSCMRVLIAAVAVLLIARGGRRANDTKSIKRVISRALRPRRLAARRSRQRPAPS